MLLRQIIDPDRTIDSGARIPSAVRLLMIDGYHLDTVFFSINKRILRIHIKSHISIILIGYFDIIHIYGRFLIDTLEFE